MYEIVTEFFEDLGVAIDTPYFTAEQMIVILCTVFMLEVLIRLISAITDLCRK